MIQLAVLLQQKSLDLALDNQIRNTIVTNENVLTSQKNIQN